MRRQPVKADECLKTIANCQLAALGVVAEVLEVPGGRSLVRVEPRHGPRPRRAMCPGTGLGGRRVGCCRGERTTCG